MRRVITASVVSNQRERERREISERREEGNYLFTPFAYFASFAFSLTFQERGLERKPQAEFKHSTGA
jgi:hypothetical protein